MRMKSKRTSGDAFNWYLSSPAVTAVNEDDENSVSGCSSSSMLDAISPATCTSLRSTPAKRKRNTVSIASSFNDNSSDDGNPPFTYLIIMFVCLVLFCFCLSLDIRSKFYLGTRVIILRITENHQRTVSQSIMIEAIFLESLIQEREMIERIMRNTKTKAKQANKRKEWSEKRHIRLVQMIRNLNGFTIIAGSYVPGHDFDPKSRPFSQEELRPQPMSKKSKKQVK